MTQDQVFVPRTRSELGLPAFDPAKETLDGSSVSQDAMTELWEAIGDAPLTAATGFLSYTVRSHLEAHTPLLNFVRDSSSDGPCT